MSETLNILVDLLNEYRESECALDEDRVTHFAERLASVVRCRDCAYFEQDEAADSCTLFDFSMDCQYMQNGFCAWGERK